MGRFVDKIKTKKTVLSVCFLLALAVWAVFGQTRGFDFVNYDDNHYVYDNPIISKGITPAGIRWVATHPHLNNWHPLTSLSNMVDVEIHGMNPGGHHLTNVLLHMATTLSMFLVFRSMTGSLWRSAFIAAVFAIHPLRAESVAWISERKDVLSGLFFMLTLGAYLRYARRPFSIGRYVPVCLLFLLGLMSKSMLVTLPFVLLLLDVWPLKRINPGAPFNLNDLKPILLEKIPLLFLSAIFCGVTIWAQADAVQDMATVSLPWRIGNALCSYATYILQTFIPVHLSPFYAHPGTELSLWQTAGSAALLIVISATVLIQWKKRPYLAVGWLWYLGMLVPVIGIMQAGGQAHADRYTYLPQMGLLLMMTWFIAELSASLRYRRLVLSISSAAVLGALAVASHAQTRYWRDGSSLWTHALAHTEDNYIAHFNLGYLLAREGNTDEAIEHYRQTLTLRPNYHEAYSNMGTALIRQNKLPEAIECFNRALKIKPDYATAYYNMGTALALQGDGTAAIKSYRHVLQIDPDFAAAYYCLGDLVVMQGNFAGAIEYYQHALKLKPDLLKALNNLAWLLATAPDANLRDGKHAVELALASVELTKETIPSALDTLAAAYAEAGRFPEAVAAARRALEGMPEGESADIIKARLKLYEAGRPYHMEQ